MWNENKQEEFDLRALLFITTNDWLALSNISGQTNKGYNACTHCLNETESIYLDKCKKNVYPGNHRFLLPTHTLRKKGKHFNGEADNRCKPIRRTGDDVFDMVKDLKVIWVLVDNLFRRTMSYMHPCGKRNLYFASYPIRKS